MTGALHFAAGFCAAASCFFVVAAMKVDKKGDHLARDVGMIAAAVFLGLSVISINYAGA